jgi:citrate synthase
MLILEKLKKKIPLWKEEILNLNREYGDKVVSDCTISQVYGGVRGVKCLSCDTSVVDPDKGLIVRGIPIIDLVDKLPEEIFYLLCTGELPNEEELKDLQKELNSRAEVPFYVWEVLKSMPKDSHPMVMLDAAILVMQKESIFTKRYNEGLSKNDYLEPNLEDSLDLLAKLPSIAAGIYRIKFNKGDIINYDSNLDWGANYAKMLGIGSENFIKLIRLYLVLHCDHESGNVSQNTCNTVSSALSDAYYAVSAGLNGLAGPLHGLANQECLRFIMNIKDKFGRVPDDEDLKKFCWDTLNSGRVVPGYGHAVLRVTDPRFTAFMNFGKEVCPDDEIFSVVEKLYGIVPNILKEMGKAKNPWPNVDAASGALLYHFGLKEFDYYTVLFAVSRSMGMLAQIILNRSLGMPIIRPKSVSTKWIKSFVLNNQVF